MSTLPRLFATATQLSGHWRDESCQPWRVTCDHVKRVAILEVDGSMWRSEVCLECRVPRITGAKSNEDQPNPSGRWDAYRTLIAITSCDRCMEIAGATRTVPTTLRRVEVRFAEWEHWRFTKQRFELVDLGLKWLDLPPSSDHAARSRYRSRAIPRDPAPGPARGPARPPQRVWRGGDRPDAAPALRSECRGARLAAHGRIVVDSVCVNS